MKRTHVIRIRLWRTRFRKRRLRSTLYGWDNVEEDHIEDDKAEEDQIEDDKVEEDQIEDNKVEEEVFLEG